MRPRRSWPILGAALLFLGSLTTVHSYAQALVSGSGTLEVTGPGDSLITTPMVNGVCIMLPSTKPSSGSPQGAGTTLLGSCGPQDLKAPQPQVTGGGPSDVETYAVVQNNTERTVLASSVSTSTPDLSVRLEPTPIQRGESARIPVHVTALGRTLPGSEPLPLRFLFTWAGGRAAIDTETTVTFVAPPPPKDKSSITTTVVK